MDWLHNIFNAFKLSTVIAALASLTFGILGLYAFVVAPTEKIHVTAKENLEQLTETYVQLKSQDLSKVVAYLNHEVDYLKQKQEKLFSHLYSVEAIPTLISKIERDAEKAGLSANTQIIREPEQQAGEEATLKLKLSFTGSFAQVVHFLNLLSNQSEMILIERFLLNSSGPSQQQLGGTMQFLVLMER